MATSNKQQGQDKGNLKTLLTAFETLLGIGSYSKVSVYLKLYVTLAIPNADQGIKATIIHSEESWSTWRLLGIPLKNEYTVIRAPKLTPSWL